MTAIDLFLSELRGLGISLSVRDGELRCRAPKGVLTPALTRDLAARKAEIVAFLEQAHGLAAEAETRIEPMPPRENPPLSFAQQRLWFVDRLEGPSATYNMPLAVRLDGDLDIPALERALTEIVARHETLRSNFVLDGHQPAVRIRAAARCPLPLEEGTGIADETIRRCAEEEARRGFDLAEDPLLRARLVRLGERSHLFLVTMHHIVSDGWSLDVFLRDLSALYGAFSRGLPSPLAPLRLRYADYAYWQRQRLQSAFLAGELSFWQTKLAGAPDVLPLPTDRPRPPVQTFGGANARIEIDSDIAAALRAVARDNGATLFMTLLAGFAILLGRHANQNDVLIGTPTAGRTHSDLETIIGLFINTLVLRFDLAANPSVRAFLAQVRRTCLEAYDHQELPFERLVEAISPTRALAHAPLVQVAFQLSASTEAATLPGLTLVPVNQLEASAKFDLALTVEEEADRLIVGCTYNPDLFDAATVDRLLDRYRTLLTTMAADPERPVHLLPMMGEADMREAVAEREWPASPYPCDETLPSLFDRAAAAHPDRVALIFADRAVTYGRLRARIDALATDLRNRGIGPEKLVAVCAERSPEMVIGLLAILKAGGAYVPLDPAHPPERLAAILGESRPALILTQDCLRARFPDGAPLLALESTGTSAPNRPVPCPAAPDNLAYVIFTSGTTGRPKGVQITHRSLTNFLVSMGREPGFSAADTLLAVTTISFDIAALELALPLVSGGRLVLADRATAIDGRALQAVLRDQAVTCLQATPATWRILTETDWRPQPGFTALCGGEALPHTLSRALLAKGVRLWNLYGPTETTIWSAVDEVRPAATEAEGAEPVGHPIANTRLSVLGPFAQPVPRGVAGQLCIGGDGLARGYFGQPGLTADRYRPDPAAQDPGARLYRTGDLVRRRGDGRLDFLGRLDHQVKIRGFRIELGEIEAILCRHPGVAEALVLVREDEPGEKRLVAYLVGATADPPEIDDLRVALKARLPDYMVPAAFVVLEAFPLSPNGKTDRRALPAPARGAPAPAQGPLAPRTATERRVAAVWSRVLGVEQLGLDDNFFDLGGHSLLLAQVHEALRGEVAKPFPLVTLFQYPTIRALATWMAEDGRPAPVAIRAAAPRGRDIAIIGMAGRFAGADDLDSFWANLRDGRSAIRFLTDQELLEAGYPPKTIANPNYVRASGHLSDITGFDAGFFGLTPAEALIIDPQHRLFLECAWHTLETAGYAQKRDEARIGVFAGCSHANYLARNLIPSLVAGMEFDVQQLVMGNDKDFLPMRVSYALGLTGPSVSVQTACSTSLTAVHMACASLAAGDCDMALTGAASVKLPRISGYTYHEGMIHSPTGRCRPFDAEADGTVWGSGVAAVLLKPLDAALADRDTIHAVIRGTAVNNDGAAKVSFTAPGLEAQAEVIATAQARAGIAPDDISYVEAHGTGTRFGDPIEVAALTRAFRAGGSTRVGSCVLGAVKPNIGHCDTTSGMAGLIKTVLALRHRQIPPTLYFRRPNPEIDFADSPFFVSDRLLDWPETDKPRRAGVSSFGIGGTNVHLILEEAPARAPSDSPRPCQLLVLSARSPAVLESMRAALAARLGDGNDPTLVDVAYSLAVGRRAFPHRLALVCQDSADGARRLAAAEGRGAQAPAGSRPAAFLFPGQGSQYACMGAELYRVEPTFRHHVDDCAERLRDRLGLDLRTLLYPAPDHREAAEARLAETWATQPALFVTEYALARLWMAWGVTPAAMIGHSIGEYVAACLAGVFDLDTALTLVAERGRLIWEQPAGAMLAVFAPAETLEGRLPDGLDLAVVNGPADCVIAGPEAAIEAFAAGLDAEGVAWRRLRTSHAFHSAQMEPVAAPFAALLGKLRLREPAIPFVSNLTGTWIRPGEAVDPQYWIDHLRRTVRFGEGIATLLGDGRFLPLEVGPGAVLTNLVRRHPAATGPVLTSLPHSEGGEGEMAGLMDSLGRSWMAGVAIDWEGVHAHDRASRIPLPVTAFERHNYFIEDPDLVPFAPRPSVGAKLPLDRWFLLPGWAPSLTPPLAGPADWAKRKGAWLVFSDGSDLARALIARLDAAGRTVTIVTAGPRYAHDGRTVTLRPMAPEDYAALLGERDGAAPDTILHLWSLGPEAEDGFDQAQERGYYPLLFLGRALARVGWTAPPSVAVIAGGLHDAGEDRLLPERATLLGPCLILPEEIPDLSCRCLDVTLPPGADPAPWADRLLAELLNGAPDPMVAYRGHRRLVPRFAPVALEPARVRQWRDKGTYLIVGGLGRVGLALARFLAETIQARLVLVGRHPPADHQPIRALEALGAEVLTVQADAADEAGMRRAFALAEDRFGPVHGVIHAAGRLKDSSFIATIDMVGEEQSRAQFAAKVQGLYALDRIVAERPVDFCLVVSSTASLLGGYGFTAYAAANAFADSFVADRARRGGTVWLAANCDAWVLEKAAPGRSGPPPLFMMTEAEGVEALSRVVCGVTAGRVVVSTGDLATRLDQASRRGTETLTAAPATALATSVVARPQMSTGYEAPAGETERRLAALWEELFGFTTVGVLDDFFELGGDSLLAIRHMTMVRTRLDHQLPLSTLLAHPTIRALARALKETESPPSLSPLTAIQPDGPLAPLFFVPGTGGNVLYLRDLAQALAGHGRPLYGFQATGIDGASAPLERIEDIAACNTQALREMQPHGPYLLGGHSFGSWVAFDMARQLLAAGERVSLVAVLDNTAPTERKLDAIENLDDARWVIAISDMLSRLYQKPHGLRYEALADLTWPEQIEALTRAMDAMGAIQSGTDASQILGFAEVFRTQARIRYQPRPGPNVPVALIRATEPLEDFLLGVPTFILDDPFWGWEQFSDGPPRLEQAPGNHLTMMARANAGRLAEILNRVLVSTEKP